MKSFKEWKLNENTELGAVNLSLTHVGNAIQNMSDPHLKKQVQEFFSAFYGQVNRLMQNSQPHQGQPQSQQSQPPQENQPQQSQPQNQPQQGQP